MKNSVRKYIPLLFAAFGAAAILLHKLVFSSYLDDRGLVIPWSVPCIALLVLTVVCAVLAAVFGKNAEEVPQPSILSAVGTVIFACGTASLFLEEARGPVALTYLFRALAAISAVCLLAAAVFKFMGRKPPFLLTTAPCALGVVHMMECYQLWSERPQMMEYAFGLGAVLLVMLFTYHYMADNAALKSKFVYIFSGLLGIYFCCGAYAQGEYAWYFAAGAVWLTTELLSAGKEPAAETAPVSEEVKEA